MALPIGAVVAQSATRFSASALDSPSRRVWRRRVEAPLSPQDAGDVITQLVRDIRAKADKGVPAAVTVCCALEADLDAQRERVTSFRYAQGWDNVRFLEVLANRLAHIAGAVSLATLTEAAAVAEYDRGAGSG